MKTVLMQASSLIGLLLYYNYFDDGLRSTSMRTQFAEISTESIYIELIKADFRYLHAYCEMRGAGYAAKAMGGLKFQAHPRS